MILRTIFCLVCETFKVLIYISYPMKSDPSKWNYSVLKREILPRYSFFIGNTWIRIWDRTTLFHLSIIEYEDIYFLNLPTLFFFAFVKEKPLNAYISCEKTNTCKSFSLSILFAFSSKYLWNRTFCRCVFKHIKTNI